MRRAVALALLLVLLSARPAAGVSVTQTIPVGSQPYGVARTPDGRLYVSNNGTNTISVVDPATANQYTISPTITVGKAPGEVAVDAAANRAYVSNFDDGTVSVIDIGAGAVIATIAPGGLGVAVDPGLSRLYVAHLSSLAVFDTTTLQQVATIPAPGTSTWWAIAVDPVRHLGYIGDLGSHLLTVVDLQTNSAVTSIDVGGPVRLALATDPGRGRVFVATDTTQGRLSMIDSSSNLVVGTATVGDFPNHILAAAADRVYVTDAGSNDLAVVDPMTWTVTLHPIDAPGTYSGSCPSHGGSCPAGLTLVGPVLYVVLSGRNVLGIIGESAPVVDGVTISPSAPRTNDTLTATVLAHDADGDPLTYTYQWTKNGSDIAGATALTLDLSVSGNGSRGDSMAVRVIASDGSLTSAPVTSTAVVIANSAPVATVALNTTAPTTQTVLVATATASDADGDALTFTYVWKVNGVVRRTTVTASTTDSFDLGRPGNGNKGDLVTVELTAFDGALSSSTATADVTIGRGR